MDEFRTKQTNPYSSQPKPEVQQVKFRPAPTPAAPVVGQAPPAPPAPQPVAPPEPQVEAQLEFIAPPEAFQPEPVTMTYQTPAPHTTTSNQTMDVIAKPQKRALSKVLIIAPLVLLAIASLSGGGWWIHTKQVATLQSQVEEFKQETASLKSNKFGSTDGQGISLLGNGGNLVESEGEVAGATTDDGESKQSSAYTGQVAIRDDKLLMEIFVDTSQTGQITAVWTNYGGSEDGLGEETEKTTKDLSDKTDGIVQMLASADLADFKPGSSYMYQMSAKAKDGKVYKTGYAVFTIPQSEAPTEQGNESQSNL